MKNDLHLNIFNQYAQQIHYMIKFRVEVFWFKLLSSVGTYLTRNGIRLPAYSGTSGNLQSSPEVSGQLHNFAFVHQHNGFEIEAINM